MFRHCIGKALSCRSKCPPALPKAHRFSWRAGSGKGSFPAVSVGSSYTSPLLLYRYADNQSRENISLPLTKLFVCNRQTTLRMDRHETIVTGRCETFRYYCLMPVHAQGGLTVTFAPWSKCKKRSRREHLRLRFDPFPKLRHHSTPYCCLNKSATMFCF